jgi:hypothetical protein
MPIDSGTGPLVLNNAGQRSISAALILALAERLLSVMTTSLMIPNHQVRQTKEESQQAPTLMQSFRGL